MLLDIAAAYSPLVELSTPRPMSCSFTYGARVVVVLKPCTARVRSKRGIDNGWVKRVRGLDVSR